MQHRRYHEDMATLHINRADPRSYYIPFGKAKAAIEEAREESDRFLSLCGEWKFRYFDRYDDVKPSLLRRNMPVSSWDSIPVPSSWQLFGYGDIEYLESKYPFPFDPPFVPLDNPTGVYARDIEIPEGLDGLQKYIVFEGVDSCFYLFVNGKFGGYSQGSHCTSEFEISELLEPGKNRITVVVLKYCDGSYLESGDRIHLSGIFREAYLLARPKGHVTDFSINVDLARDYKTAKILVKLHAVNPQEAVITLLDSDGSMMKRAYADIYGTASLMIEDPLLWSAEAPELYTVLIECAGEFICERVGIRDASVDDGVFRINGRAVKLKGVNRQDFDAGTGCALNVVQMFKELCRMKQFNINAVMTAHYPPDPRFMQLCDRLGFYVIAQADLDGSGTINVLGESSGEYFNAFAGDDQWEAAILDRVERMYERDKNRVGIICWSAGNRAGCGKNIINALNTIKLRDLSRPVLYAGVYNGQALPQSDIVGCFGLSAEGCVKFLENEEERRPLLLCEYTVSGGNSMGGLKDYWDVIYADPRCCGAFVRQWGDQAVKVSGQSGRLRYVFGKDFGESSDDGGLTGLLTPDKKAKSGLLCLKYILQPVRVTAVNLQKGEFDIENLYNFIYLSRLECVYEVTRQGETVHSESLGALAIPPLRTERIKLQYELPADGECYVKISFLQRGVAPWVVDSQEMAAFQFSLPVSAKTQEPYHFDPGDDEKPAAKKPEDVKPKSAQNVFIKERDKDFDIIGQGFVYSINKETGLFSRMMRNGKELLDGLMDYNTWRAPTDNDLVFPADQWRQAGYDRLQPRVYSISCCSEDGKAVVRAQSVLAAPSLLAGINIGGFITVDGEGTADITLKVSISDDFPGLPRFGLRMIMPREYDRVEFFGSGPDESYSDKKAHCFVSRYHMTMETMWSDYLRPQENGNRHCVKWAGITDSFKSGIRLSNPDGFDFSALPYTAREMEEAGRSCDLMPSDKTVVCADYLQSGVGGSGYRAGRNPRYLFCEQSFEQRIVIETI